MNFNVRLMVTAEPVNLDELVRVKLLIKKACIEEFGEDNFGCTDFFKSEEYGNMGFYVYLNVQKPKIQLEVREDANNR